LIDEVILLCSSGIDYNSIVMLLSEEVGYGMHTPMKGGRIYSELTTGHTAGCPKYGIRIVKTNTAAV